MSETETIEEQVGLPNPQSIYDIFETDDSLELDGVWFDYAFGRFKLAYVGGANQKFQHEYANRMRPYAEAEATGQMDAEIRRKIQIECYVLHVLRDWKKVVGRDGKQLKYNEKNAIKLFTDLPHLFNMIRTAATNFANYRRLYADDVSGN